MVTLASNHASCYRVISDDLCACRNNGAMCGLQHAFALMQHVMSVCRLPGGQHNIKPRLTARIDAHVTLLKAATIATQTVLCSTTSNTLLPSESRLGILEHRLCLCSSNSRGSTSGEAGEQRGCICQDSSMSVPCRVGPRMRCCPRCSMLSMYSRRAVSNVASCVGHWLGPWIGLDGDACMPIEQPVKGKALRWA